MADEMDKFVLAYQVTLGDSIKKLEQLRDKMGKVDEAHAKGEKGLGGLKGAAKAALGALGEVPASMTAISAAVSEMVPGLKIAVGALVAMKVAADAVNKARATINRQQQQSMATAIAPLQLEDWERKLIGGDRSGTLNRANVAEKLGRIRELTDAARLDLTGVGPDALKLRALGVNPRDFGNSAATAKDMFSWASGRSREEVIAMAQAAGIDPNVLLSAKANGADAMNNISLSEGEVEARQAATESVLKLNQAQSQLAENSAELSNTFGQLLMPLKTLWAQTKNLAVEGVNDVAKEATSGHFWHDIIAAARIANVDGPQVDPKEAEKQRAEGHKELKAAADKSQKAAQKAVDTQQKSADDAQKLKNDEIQQINLFAQAVGQFAGATISHEQALAAWAGELGASDRATAIASPGGYNATPAANDKFLDTWKQSPYAASIEAAAKKWGMHPQQIAAIFPHESGGNPNAVNKSSGAMGLGQVLPKIWSAPGYGNGRNPYDPASNIDVSAHVLHDALKRANGDPILAMKYYSGGAGQAYMEDYRRNLYGDSGASTSQGGHGIGQSRASLNRTRTQGAMAGALGLDVQQVQRGDFRAADAAFVAGNTITVAKRAIAKLDVQIANLPKTTPQYDRVLGGLQAQRRQQELFINSYGRNVAGVVGSGQAGDQFITKGAVNPAQITNNFTINGVTDPKELSRMIADQVNQQLHLGATEIQNHFASGIRR